MLDIQSLRTNLGAVAERLATRGVALDTVAFEALEAERKRLQVHTQDLQAKRNTLSKQIGMLKGCLDEKGRGSRVLPNDQHDGSCGGHSQILRNVVT